MPLSQPLPSHPDDAGEVASLRDRYPLDRVAAMAFGREGTAPWQSGPVDLPFPIASVTKTFTAALCLEPETRLLLDTPIRQVLPEFQLADEQATREMTPRDALCHFSGLAPATDTWVESRLSRLEFVATQVQKLPFAKDFRDQHRYSNVIYAVVGQWLEAVTGQSWEDLIGARIREPLELDSLHVLEPGWEKVCPTPHQQADDTLEVIPPFFSRRNHLIAPASELRISMRDLATWGAHHLTLDPGDERWHPHNLITESRPFRELGPLHYGLGWRIDTVHGEQRVWHSGQCSGYTTLLTLYPESGRGMACATNCSAAVEPLQLLDLARTQGNLTP